MGQNSKIEWTEHTFNPWWGCVRVAAGCANCYAATLSHRFGHDVWGKMKPRRTFGNKHWNEPVKWNRKAQKDGRQARVFCGSMCDVFEAHSDPEWNMVLNEQRNRLWNLIEETPALTWLLLTKRPENIEVMLPQRWFFAGLPSNVWFGYSASTQDDFDKGWPIMEAVGYHHLPAVIFLSLEPLLGPIDLSPRLETTSGYADEFCYERGQRGVDWVITGPETGPGARERDRFEERARNLRDQCISADVKFFLKKNINGTRLLDGRTWDQFPGTEAERVEK